MKRVELGAKVKVNAAYPGPWEYIIGHTGVVVARCWDISPVLNPWVVKFDKPICVDLASPLLPPNSLALQDAWLEVEQDDEKFTTFMKTITRLDPVVPKVAGIPMTATEVQANYRRGLQEVAEDFRRRIGDTGNRWDGK